MLKFIPSASNLFLQGATRMYQATANTVQVVNQEDQAAAIAAGWTQLDPTAPQLLQRLSDGVLLGYQSAKGALVTLPSYATDPLTGGISLTLPSGGLMPLLHNPYDVCIYGSTAAGIVAAVAACREGKSVIVVSPDARVGGMVGNGIANTDNITTPTTQPKSIIPGIADEFYASIAKEYGTSQQTFYTGFGGANGYGAENKVQYSALMLLIARYGIKVYLDVNLTSVSKTGAKITSLGFDNLASVVASAFIDATYEGDLLAMAGCSYIVGREANATYGETNNGVRAVSASVPEAFANNVDPYVTAGVPGSGLLPGISSSALGTLGTADGNVQALVYRMAMQTGAGKVAIPAPTNYNPQLYELLGRDFAGGGGSLPTSFLTLFTGYPVQNSKYDVNTRWALSTNYVGPECAEYITATPARRAVIRLIVKDYILGLFQWIATDARVPVGVKNDIATYGLCPDEFLASGSNFPPLMYVREGRRMISDAFPVSGKPCIIESNMTAADNGFTNPVAFGYYTVDCHHVQRVVVGGFVKTEGRLPAISQVIGWKIPYNVMLPKAAECTNLLVTCAVAASHVAYCGMRLEPNFMSLGHAAGVASSLMVERGITAQSVTYSDLKYRLDYSRTRAAYWMTVDAGVGNVGVATQTGTWTATLQPNGNSVSTNILTSTTSTSTAVFNPTLPESGYYRVMVRYSAKSGRQNALPCVITHADGTTNRKVNETETGHGGDWDDLGSYMFYSTADQTIFTGATHGVTFTVPASGSTVALQAVKFVSVNPQPQSK